MLKAFTAPFLLGLVALAGCSSNPNAIEPNPLPEFEARYDVDRLWRSGAGDAKAMWWPWTATMASRCGAPK